ncbi:MAG: hypothetical protein R2713_11410 [Ilumatobacteraceae bacterium]
MSRFLPIAASCLLVACSADVATGVPSSGSVAAPALPPPLARMVSDRPAPPIDTMEVWVCDVPAGATAAVYGGLTLREPLTPDGIVAAIGDRLHAYVDTVSGGRTDLRLVSGARWPWTSTTTTMPAPRRRSLVRRPTPMWCSRSRRHSTISASPADGAALAARSPAPVRVPRVPPAGRSWSAPTTSTPRGASCRCSI